MSLPFNDLVIVALGGNLAGGFASIEALLEAAIARMSAVGLMVLARSSWWRSASWPDPDAPEYRNGVAIVETALEPHALLAALREIEAALGRVRGETNAPRTLDLDLIAYGRLTLGGPELVLPHPRAAERLFVMGPLAEMAPDWIHPTLGLTALELAAEAGVGRDARPCP